MSHQPKSSQDPTVPPDSTELSDEQLAEASGGIIVVDGQPSDATRAARTSLGSKLLGGPDTKFPTPDDG